MLYSFQPCLNLCCDDDNNNNNNNIVARGVLVPKYTDKPECAILLSLLYRYSENDNSI